MKQIEKQLWDGEVSIEEQIDMILEELNEYAEAGDFETAAIRAKEFAAEVKRLKRGEA